jgi:hypothetical protein
VARHAALVAALDATDGSTPLDALTMRFGGRQHMSRLLAEHDRLVVPPPTAASMPSTPTRSRSSTRPRRRSPRPGRCATR